MCAATCHAVRFGPVEVKMVDKSSSNAAANTGVDSFLQVRARCWGCMLPLNGLFMSFLSHVTVTEFVWLLVCYIMFET
jgi:hypothetical protein